MSVENNVFLLRENLPTSQQWLDTIKLNGFDMDMDIDFDIVEHEGFVPCKYKGKDAGFEYWTEEVDINELLEEEMITAEQAAQLGNRSFLVTFTTRSDFRDYITSMIASAVLCSISDGMLAEAGEPPFILSSNAIKWAKEGVLVIEKEL